MIDLDELTAELRDLYRRRTGRDPCLESLDWAGKVAGGGPVEAWLLLDGIDTALCADLSLDPFRAEANDDRLPIVEALAAHYLGLDLEAANPTGAKHG